MRNFQPKLMKHGHAHEAIIANEYWYGDGPPLLKASFSAAKTADRQAEVVKLLEKAANKSKARGYHKHFRQLRKLPLPDFKRFRRSYISLDVSSAIYREYGSSVL